MKRKSEFGEQEKFSRGFVNDTLCFLKGAGKMACPLQFRTSKVYFAGCPLKGSCSIVVVPFELRQETSRHISLVALRRTPSLLRRICELAVQPTLAKAEISRRKTFSSNIALWADTKCYLLNRTSTALHNFAKFSCDLVTIKANPFVTRHQGQKRPSASVSGCAIGGWHRFCGSFWFSLWCGLKDESLWLFWFGVEPAPAVRIAVQTKRRRFKSFPSLRSNNRRKCYDLGMRN